MNLGRALSVLVIIGLARLAVAQQAPKPHQQVPRKEMSSSAFARTFRENLGRVAKSPFSISGKVINNGIQDTTNSFPHAVAIYGSGDTIICSGVLLDGSHVLAAAHCANDAFDIVDDVVADASSVHYPILGLPAIYGGPEELAIFTLSKTVPQISRIRRATASEIDAESGLRLVGYGTAASGTPGDRAWVDLAFRTKDCSGRVATDVTEAEFYGCKATYQAVLEGDSTTPHGSSCSADSGGPALIMTSANAYTLAGVINGPSTQAYCGGPTIVTRIDGVENWIKAIVP